MHHSSGMDTGNGTHHYPQHPTEEGVCDSLRAVVQEISKDRALPQIEGQVIVCAEAAPGLHAHDVCTGVSVPQSFEYRHLLLWIVVCWVDDWHLYKSWGCLSGMIQRPKPEGVCPNIGDLQHLVSKANVHPVGGIVFMQALGCAGQDMAAGVHRPRRSLQLRQLHPSQARCLQVPILGSGHPGWHSAQGWGWVGAAHIIDPPGLPQPHTITAAVRLAWNPRPLGHRARTADVV
mmetsp:Transcript_4180/g.7361  ORF Transcript_4180/g.7361 Transcript_4180/m.7361 type:complete len:233 (-) Transcript_4180:196-894(-)